MKESGLVSCTACNLKSSSGSMPQNGSSSRQIVSYSSRSWTLFSWAQSHLCLGEYQVAYSGCKVQGHSPVIETLGWCSLVASLVFSNRFLKSATCPIQFLLPLFLSSLYELKYWMRAIRIDVQQAVRLICMGFKGSSGWRWPYTIQRKISIPRWATLRQVERYQKANWGI